MGRNIQVNQRSQLPANRELRRAISAPRTKSFGIRRLADDETNLSFQAMWDTLQGQGDIPASIEPREHTGVTLLPRRVLGKQLTQGLVIGHKLGQAHSRIEHDQELAGTKDMLEVTLGEVRVLRRKVVYVEVISEELLAERERLYAILGSLGFKGAKKSLSKPLHITFGESMTPITRTEERHVEQTIQHNLLDISVVNLHEWDTYPNFDQISA